MLDAAGGWCRQFGLSRPAVTVNTLNFGQFHMSLPKPSIEWHEVEISKRVPPN
jgi:hypothetical protein